MEKTKIKHFAAMLLLVLLAAVTLPLSASAAAKTVYTLNVTASNAAIKSSKMNLYIGTKTQLTVKLGSKKAAASKYTYKKLSQTAVTYKSSNPSVAAVSKKGVITPKKSGKTVITLTYKSRNLTKKITATVSKPAPKLSKTSLTLNVGKSSTLSVSGTSSKAVWSSSKKSIATVSAKGTVKALKKGTATVTAKVNGKRLTCKVTVKQPVTSVKLNKSSVTLTAIGQTSTLTATASPSTANTRTVSWSSSNPKVATVDSAGKVTAVSNGTATITAKAKDGSGKKATCGITVKEEKQPATDGTAIKDEEQPTTNGTTVKDEEQPATDGTTVKDEKRPVTSVTLDQTSVTLTTFQETVTLKAGVAPTAASDKTIAWSSSDPKVATVDSAGKVTAVSNGTATITAAAKDGSGKKADCKVAVVFDPTNVVGYTWEYLPGTEEKNPTVTIRLTNNTNGTIYINWHMILWNMDRIYVKKFQMERVDCNLRAEGYEDAEIGETEYMAVQSGEMKEIYYHSIFSTRYYYHDFTPYSYITLSIEAEGKSYAYVLDLSSDTPGLEYTGYTSVYDYSSSRDSGTLIDVNTSDPNVNIHIDKRECPMCRRNPGKCSNCDGTGKMRVPIHSLLGDYCRTCNGNGKCVTCKGKGFY